VLPRLAPITIAHAGAHRPEARPTAVGIVAGMTDADCVAFLQWALPRLGRRWSGYRKVRRQVCRRVWRRVAELGLDSLAEYRRHLEQDPDEWPRLDAMTNITISRFYRDRATYDFLRSEVLPALIDRARDAERSTVRVWSAGCASGEEPYTLAIIWELALASAARGVRLEIFATDIKPEVLRRADQAGYPRSALRDLPAAWCETAFSQDGDEWVLLPRFRRGVTLAQHDIRTGPPDGPFDLVLCRYLAFTYFDDAGQRAMLRTLARVIRPDGALVLGNRERLRVFQRCADGSSPSDHEPL
jgi:chemotaxis protein methyltransferase CheR